MNESGVMISVVAIGDGEHFMGHLAAKRNRPDDVLLELGVMLVAPAYRSLGIAGSLNVHLLDEIKKTSVKSVFARAVAGHTVSQKMGEKIGLRPCAIMLGTFPKNVEFKQLTGVITEKMSCLVLWKAMQQPRKESSIFHPGTGSGSKEFMTTWACHGKKRTPRGRLHAHPGSCPAGIWWTFSISAKSTCPTVRTR